MERVVRDLWTESRELTNSGDLNSAGAGAGGVERLESPPSPLQFLRDYVSPNKPVIICNATRHWPAIDLWSSSAYLRRALAGNSVSVHLTPTGRADALATSADGTLCFASPFVQSMDFDQALDLIDSTGQDPNQQSDQESDQESSQVVAYLQQQNDCLRSEFSALTGDVDPHISFATSALGFQPEAVNMWIGNSRSETSFHKDHYENLYAVITGSKQFTLVPPCEMHRLYVKSYPVASYVMKGNNKLELEKEASGRTVPWCSVDPYPKSESEMAEQVAKFPLYFDGPKPICCTVNPGEILYLPSMWFHHVRQTPDENGQCIAVNYWYDMQFDIKYAYFNFLQSIHLPSLGSDAASIKKSEDNHNNHNGKSDYDDTNGHRL